MRGRRTQRDGGVIATPPPPTPRPAPPSRRAKPNIMRDLHANYTAVVRRGEEIDLSLGRAGLDTVEEALVALGLRAPYSPEDLSVMTTTTTKYKPAP